jgi:tetratricopeptide (TPR) repeat protein
MYKKQIAVIVVVVATMGYLYSLPVKGLIKPKESRTGQGAKINESRQINSNINVDYVSSAAKAAVGANIANDINALESNLKKVTDDGAKVNLQRQLAKKWDDVNQPAPAAFYYLAVAKAKNNYQDWIDAGDRFNDAYKFTQDTTAQPVFVTNAVEAFQSALKLKPESLDAKTGLGVADVNGGAASPMEGIGLLREVVAKDPKNRKANLNLGMFAMKSGQYQKAVERFKTLIAEKPEVEPYFYLAESYKQLGMKAEAIDAYQKCKSMMPDPAFGQRIDEFIKELKN